MKETLEIGFLRKKQDNYPDLDKNKQTSPFLNI